MKLLLKIKNGTPPMRKVGYQRFFSLSWGGDASRKINTQH